MSSQGLKSFFLQDHFLTRSNLIELALGAIFIVSLGAVFDSFTRDILIPWMGLFISYLPDLSSIRPFGIGIGNFITTLVAFLIKAASLYFLVVFPVNHFARGYSTREQKTETPESEL